MFYTVDKARLVVIAAPSLLGYDATLPGFGAVLPLQILNSLKLCQVG